MHKKVKLPEGWKTVLLDRVAERGSGHTPNKKISRYWNGGIKWISLADSSKLDKIHISSTKYEISEEGIKNSSAVVHPPGVVVLSRDAGVGKSAITTCEMAVSQHFITWKCGPDLHNYFLYYWLQYMKPVFEKIASGSTIKTIGLPFFQKLEITLPPLNDQIAIVNPLLCCDNNIGLLENLLSAKAKLKYGLRQQLLTGKKRLQEFVGQEWDEKSFGELLTESRIKGSTGVTAKKITIKLYGKGVVEKQGRSKGSQNTSYYMRKAGQFIYSKLDFLNGAFGIIPSHLDGYESTLDLPAFDLTAALDPGWLLYFVTQEGFYTKYKNAAEGGRKARRVQPDEFLRTKVNLPSIKEQRRIAGVLETCDKEIELLNKQLSALKRQRLGLMQKLLTGQIRVKVKDESQEEMVNA